MLSNLKILRVLVVLFFGISIFFAYLNFDIGFSSVFNSSYYAVYLESGEIYLGKLRRFPSLTLSDVYLLVRIKDNNEVGSYALHRFQDEEWGPSDLIKLNNKKILWMTKLKEDGQAMKAIRGGTDDSTNVSEVK